MTTIIKLNNLQQFTGIYPGNRESINADGKIKLSTGDLDEVAAVFGLFYKFAPAKNYKIPPLED